MPPPPVPFAIRIVFTDAAQREATSLLNDGRFTQRLGLIESRQARLERDLKQVEMQMNGFVEQLAHRPLKTDVISAIAQQELARLGMRALLKSGYVVGSGSEQHFWELFCEFSGQAALLQSGPEALRRANSSGGGMTAGRNVKFRKS